MQSRLYHHGIAVRRASRPIGLVSTPLRDSRWGLLNILVGLARDTLAHSSNIPYTTVIPLLSLACWLPNPFDFQTITIVVTDCVVVQKALRGFQQFNGFTYRHYCLQGLLVNPLPYSYTSIFLGYGCCVGRLIYLYLTSHKSAAVGRWSGSAPHQCCLTFHCSKE